MPKTCEDCGGTFEAGKHAKFCPRCRPLHRENKRCKYVLDGIAIELLKDRYDSRVRGRAGEIARQLGWPTFAVKKAAKVLGLAGKWPADRRPWKTEEVAFLREWAGVRSASWIAKKIGRSETSVVLKLKRLRMSRRIANGYSVPDVADCFGVNHHSVDRWIEQGWLRPTVEGGDRSRVYSRYSDNELRRFVAAHPLEFRLDKVDQVWFLGLILGTPVLDQARAG